MHSLLDNSIISAAEQWGLDVRSIRKDIDFWGSPERCEFRFAIECANENLYVIESLIEEEVRHKDLEMIDLETVYMKLLIDNADDLKQIWKI